MSLQPGISECQGRKSDDATHGDGGGGNADDDDFISEGTRTSSPSREMMLCCSRETRSERGEQEHRGPAKERCLRKSPIENAYLHFGGSRAHVDMGISSSDVALPGVSRSSSLSISRSARVAVCESV